MTTWKVNCAPPALSVILLLVSQGVSSQTSSPEIACTVDAALGEPGSGRKRVSNLKQIVMTATVTGAGFNIEPVRVGVPDANFEVVVTNTNGVEFPTILFLRSAGARVDAQTADIGFGVPIAEEQRDAQIEAFVQTVRNDPDVDQAERELLDALQDVGIEELKRSFFESRTGEFQVLCRYVPEKLGFWNGELESEAEPIEVVSEGSFFSQPQFQR